jgi:hypothetical protein
MPFGISSPFGSPFGTASANTNNVQLTDIGSHHAETNATVDQVDATVDQVEEPTDIDLHALRALHHQYPHSDMYQVHSAEETFDSYVQRDIEQRDIEQHGAEPYGPKQGPEQRPKQGSEQGDIEQHGAEQGPRQDKEPGATRALIRASNLALVRDLVRASNRSPRLRNQNGDSLEDLERDFMSKAHRSKAKGKAGTEDSGQIADSGRASSASSASASAALNSTLHDTSIHVVHVDEQLRRNFVMHVVPACLAAVTVAVLCVGSLAHANVLYVMATTLGMLLVMFLGYLCIPVRNEKTGELLYGWRKIQYVYGDPPPLPFVAQTLFMLLAVAAIPLCMIGTSTDKASVWTSWDKWLTWNKRTHVGADVTNNLSADAGADVGAGAGADAGADAIPTAQIVPQNAVGIADFDSFDASL